MDLGAGNVSSELEVSSTFLILLLQTARPAPTDGSYREASLNFIEGKDAAIRTMGIPIPSTAQPFARQAELDSEKSMALAMRHLSA